MPEITLDNGDIAELVIDEEVYRKIWESFIQTPRFKPYHIMFDPPYDEIAFWLEHGTGPAAPGKREPPRSDGMRAKERIGKWAEGASFIDGRNEDVKNEMYERIMQAGTPPHPFIRPAFEDLMDGDAVADILQNGGSIEDILNAAVDLMILYLKDNNSIGAGTSESDSIISHIHVVPYTGDSESDMDTINASEILNGEWERLDAMMSGMHAQNLAAYRARKGGS